MEAAGTKRPDRGQASCGLEDQSPQVRGRERPYIKAILHKLKHKDSPHGLASASPCCELRQMPDPQVTRSSRSVPLVCCIWGLEHARVFKTRNGEGLFLYIPRLLKPRFHSRDTDLGCSTLHRAGEVSLQDQKHWQTGTLLRRSWKARNGNPSENGT